MFSFIKKIIFYSLSITLGICTTLLFVEILSFVLLKIKPKSYPLVTPYSTQTFAHELPRAEIKLPKYNRTFQRDFIGSLEPTLLPFWDSNKNVYFSLKNFAQQISFKTSEGDFVYSHYVSTDNNRRRTSHTSEKQLLRKKHLLFMGCSFTWGHLVNDEETLPSLINKQQEEFTAYNLGFTGYSPAHIYQMLKHEDWLKDIPQQEGMAFYISLPFHLDRAAGLTGDHFLSRMEYDEELKMHYVPEEIIATRVFPYINEAYSKTHFFALTGIQLPLVRDKHYREFALLIREIEMVYKQSFQSKNPFVVFLFPDSDPKKTERIKKFLDEKNISFLDYSRLDWNSYVPSGKASFDEGHPNPEGYVLISKIILSHLKNLKNPPPVQ
jgi:hypothetical protein